MNDVVKTRRDGTVIEVTLDQPKANAIDLATSRIMGRPSRRSGTIRICGWRSSPAAASGSSAPVGI